MIIATCEDKASPIYGMSIINVVQVKTVFALKRSMASGFAGIENPLSSQKGRTGSQPIQLKFRAKVKTRNQLAKCE